jgi:hypothetical protein
MASFVKTKVSISLICTVVLLLLPLLYSNFNAPPSFTRWGEPINWNNFDGVPRIFSKYDASISSTIYLDFDSATQQYYAYAALDNNQSWAKTFVKDSSHSYLLGHEQYHFNITEVYARLLNNFIRENPGHDELYYKHKLYALELELNDMQDAYDEESNHSINIDQQRWWEYRIDSLLQLHAGESGIVTDYYSGAQVYFSIKPVQATGINKNEVPYRYISTGKYDMKLYCLIYQHETYESDTASVNSYARTVYDGLRLPVRSRTVNAINNEFVLKIVADDTLNKKRLHDCWIVRPPYLFRASTEMPYVNKDTIGYYKIAQSFLNSFSVNDTDSYWKAKLSNDTTRVVITPMVTVKAPEKYLSKTCYTIPPGAVHGFYRGPIQYNDQWLIAYDIADQPDSLINEHAIYVNNKLITFNDSSADVLYVTPAGDEPKRPFTVAVGYVIRNDTTPGCRIMHNQKIRVE